MNRVRLSSEAQADLREIKEHIADELDNPAAANRLIKRITVRIRSLLQFPQQGVLLSSVCSVEGDYRCLVCGQYIVFYRVSGNEVYVDRILHGRRDYMRALFGELESEATTE
ncbi:MAG: type II toxin-antitoxin system RelE/ParE family toxin [Firmicutes bacterium]|jgi:toxin ParE1/3/4|nr:type II toxin-antitoxin system RelE/ParE family toxin [Bacillota bacterium]